MTQTQQAPTLARLTRKSEADVKAMLHDIATVLRLTAKVKAEIVRERAEADVQAILAGRAARAAELDAIECSVA